jgi:hypothetical protein
MSGAGDTDGGSSRDEAAWRDLVARFDRPADAALTEVPWPAREDLPGSAAARAAAGLAAADTAAPDRPGPANPASPASPASPANPANPANPAAEPVSPPDEPGALRGARTWQVPSSSHGPADRTRVVRPAGDPRSYIPPDEEDDRYVPAPLPPPAKLDPISKAALVGVIGGPGYLLVVSVFLHWTISATAAFIAVAAFIGGFVTLVVKLGDRPRRDDDDDGAVL